MLFYLQIHYETIPKKLISASRDQDKSKAAPANFLQEPPIFMRFSLKDVEFQAQTSDSQHYMAILLP